MTHAELIEVGRRFLRELYENAMTHGHGRCSVIAVEQRAMTDEIPDLLGWCAEKSVLVECKVSRSDFFADQKKRWRSKSAGVGRTRWYMVPSGLIYSADLPEGYGLVWAIGPKAWQVIERPTPREDFDLAAERYILLALARKIKS